MLTHIDFQGLEELRAFATSLAIGLLVGLERERQPSAKAGLRTFALIDQLCEVKSMIGKAEIIAM